LLTAAHAAPARAAECIELFYALMRDLVIRLARHVARDSELSEACIKEHILFLCAVLAASEAAWLSPFALVSSLLEEYCYDYMATESCWRQGLPARLYEALLPAALRVSMFGCERAARRTSCACEP
jgi:hypothetical protein